MNIAMKIIIIVMLMLSLNAHSGWFDKDNYWHCLLAELDDVQSDTIAQELIDRCKGQYPFYTRIWVSKETPLFGVKSANQCVSHYGKEINSELAARYIQAACYKLYPDD